MPTDVPALRRAITEGKAPLEAVAAAARLCEIAQGNKREFAEVAQRLSDETFVMRLVDLAESGVELCHLPLALLGYLLCVTGEARGAVHPVRLCGVLQGLLRSGDPLLCHECIFVLRALAVSEAAGKLSVAMCEVPSLPVLLSSILRESHHRHHRAALLDILTAVLPLLSKISKKDRIVSNLEQCSEQLPRWDRGEAVQCRRIIDQTRRIAAG
eukprot:Sspe_Gene.90987::Locus_62469_Transcript_1_1_Confidence_1.000_Length_728::g.90987::m.90987